MQGDSAQAMRYNLQPSPMCNDGPMFVKLFHPTEHWSKQCGGVCGSVYGTILQRYYIYIYAITRVVSRVARATWRACPCAAQRRPWSAELTVSAVARPVHWACAPQFVQDARLALVTLHQHAQSEAAHGHTKLQSCSLPLLELHRRGKNR